MANIALPTIESALDFDDGQVQWVLTSFALTVRHGRAGIRLGIECWTYVRWIKLTPPQFGGFLLICGRLCDILGFKAVLLSGMTIFNAASLLCALVNNRIGLLVGRALQGACLPSGG